MRVLGGGAAGRWLEHKVRAPVNGISVLLKEASESSLPPFHHVMFQWQGNQLWTRKLALARYQVCQGLDLGLSSVHKYEKSIFLVSKSPSLWYPVISPNGLTLWLVAYFYYLKWSVVAFFDVWRRWYNSS